MFGSPPRPFSAPPRSAKDLRLHTPPTTGRSTHRKVLLGFPSSRTTGHLNPLTVNENERVNDCLSAIQTENADQSIMLELGEIQEESSFDRTAVLNELESALNHMQHVNTLTNEELLTMLRSDGGAFFEVDEQLLDELMGITRKERPASPTSKSKYSAVVARNRFIYPPPRNIGVNQRLKVALQDELLGYYYNARKRTNLTLATVCKLNLKLNALRRSEARKMLHRQVRTYKKAAQQPEYWTHVLENQRCSLTKQSIDQHQRDVAQRQKDRADAATRKRKQLENLKKAATYGNVFRAEIQAEKTAKQETIYATAELLKMWGAMITHASRWKYPMDQILVRRATKWISREPLTKTLQFMRKIVLAKVMARRKKRILHAKKVWGWHYMWFRLWLPVRTRRNMIRVVTDSLQNFFAMYPIHRAFLAYRAKIVRLQRWYRSSAERRHLFTRLVGFQFVTIESAVIKESLAQKEHLDALRALSEETKIMDNGKKAKGVLTAVVSAKYKQQTGTDTLAHKRRLQMAKTEEQISEMVHNEEAMHNNGKIPPLIRDQVIDAWYQQTKDNYTRAVQNYFTKMEEYQRSLKHARYLEAAKGVMKTGFTKGGRAFVFRNEHKESDIRPVKPHFRFVFSKEEITELIIHAKREVVNLMKAKRAEILNLYPDAKKQSEMMSKFRHWLWMNEEYDSHHDDRLDKDISAFALPDLKNTDLLNRQWMNLKQLNHTIRKQDLKSYNPFAMVSDKKSHTLSNTNSNTNNTAKHPGSPSERRKTLEMDKQLEQEMVSMVPTSLLKRRQSKVTFLSDAFADSLSSIQSPTVRSSDTSTPKFSFPAEEPACSTPKSYGSSKGASPSGSEMFGSSKPLTAVQKRVLRRRRMSTIVNPQQPAKVISSNIPLLKELHVDLLVQTQ